MGIDIYAIGDTVSIGPFKGRVVQVCINNYGIRYEIGYWKGDKYKEAWFPAHEVSSERKKQPIGFKG